MPYLTEEAVKQVMEGLQAGAMYVDSAHPANRIAAAIRNRTKGN